MTHREVVGCTGKIKHQSFESAKSVAINMTTGPKNTFWAYQCNFCGSFHVGKSKRSKRR